MQSMNGVNLQHFQFEYDLTWMAFFQNSEGRTYARYGGREDHGPETHLTKASLMRVMRQVLSLHETNDVQAASKYEPVPNDTFTPSQIPTMKPMMAKRKDSSCIHCHDVKVARLRHQRHLGKLEKEMVFTYPTPKLFGVHIDPDNQNRIARIETHSPADTAGLKVDDVLTSIDGQRILTFGDLTRVLEFAPEPGPLTLHFRRNDEEKHAVVQLPVGWKRSSDPSWRPSLGTVGPGTGFWGRPANESERKKLGLSKADLALRVTFIWAPHAKASGVKLNDYVVSIDGQTHDMTMRQMHAYLHLNRNWGDEISLIVRRKGQLAELKMQLPDQPLE